MEDLLTSFILSSLGGGGEGWEARKYKYNLHFTNQADIKKCRGVGVIFMSVSAKISHKSTSTFYFLNKKTTHHLMFNWKRRKYGCNTISSSDKKTMK